MPIKPRQPGEPQTRSKPRKAPGERCLQPHEVLTVAEDLRRKAKRSDLAKRHLALFALATGCGLRVSELIALSLGDIDLERRTIAVRNGKGAKARLAPIWDAGTFNDLSMWIDHRRAEGATSGDYVLTTKLGTPLNRSDASKTFGRVCKVLKRPVAPSIHDGRHSFLSNALHAGKPLPAVQRAAGHDNITTTANYLHEIGSNDELIDLFKV